MFKTVYQETRNTADLFASMEEARQEHAEARQRAAQEAAEAAERQAAAEGLSLYLALGDDIARIESQPGWVEVALALEEGTLSAGQRSELQARLGRVAVLHEWATEASVRDAGFGSGSPQERLVTQYNGRRGR